MWICLFPRYVHEDMDALPRTYASGADCLYLAMKVLCGPDGLPGESDFLFHNKGDGTFEEVSKKAGVDDSESLFRNAGRVERLENTGWPDLYVSNDTGANYLYHNKRDGTFEDMGLLSGAAVDAEGRTQASMGVAIADDRSHRAVGYCRDHVHAGRRGLVLRTAAIRGLSKSRSSRAVWMRRFPMSAGVTLFSIGTIPAGWA